MHRRRFLSLALAAMPVAIAGCAGSGGGGSTGGSTVVAVARANGAATFARAVGVAGLADRLDGPGPYTVFAPTDAAFRALPPGRLDALLRDPEALSALVGYHVVPGLVSVAFMDGFDVNHLTATGDALSVDGTAQPIRVDGARVVRADLEARNGVVHLIDRVLAP